MDQLDPLRTNLLDLLVELRGKKVPLTIGGGFGLYLKREHVEQSGRATLLEHLPEPRSTSDIDLFIRVEIIVNPENFRLLGETVEHLGYEAIGSARYMQWVKTILVGGVPQKIKLDLLSGPSKKEHDPFLRIEDRRMKSKTKGIRLHTRFTEEALHVDEDLLQLTISGILSSGEPAEEIAFVPQAFSYLMMKLFAFRDLKNKKEKDMGRHHALDLYHIIAMMTEAEYQKTLDLAKQYCRHDKFQEACQIVHEDFSSITDIGILRLREHPLFRDPFELTEMIDVLAEIFNTE